MPSPLQSDCHMHALANVSIMFNLSLLALATFMYHMYFRSYYIVTTPAPRPSSREVQLPS